jgi:hypothetical protein
MVDDNSLSRTVPVDLDGSLLVFRLDRRIKSKSLLVHPKKTKNCEHKLEPIVIDVELFGYDAPESIKHPNSHEKFTDSEAQDKAAGVLHSEHFPRVLPKIKPGLRSFIGRRVALELPCRARGSGTSSTLSPSQLEDHSQTQRPFVVSPQSRQ